MNYCNRGVVGVGRLFKDRSFEGFQFVVAEDFGECDRLAACLGLMGVYPSAAPADAVAVVKLKDDLAGLKRNRIGKDVGTGFTDVEEDAFRVPVRILGPDSRNDALDSLVPLVFSSFFHKWPDPLNGFRFPAKTARIPFTDR
jgi:hypothetical protein